MAVSRERRGWEKERSRKRNGQEDGGESAGAANLVCSPIIRGRVPSRADRHENVSFDQVAPLSPEVKVDFTNSLAEPNIFREESKKKKPHLMTYRIFFTNSTSRLPLKQKDN